MPIPHPRRDLILAKLYYGQRYGLKPEEVRRLGVFALDAMTPLARSITTTIVRLERITRNNRKPRKPKPAPKPAPRKPPKRETTAEIEMMMQLAERRRKA
jgi:hypothetical protein